MLEMNMEKVAGLSVIIVTGGLANVFLLLALLVTWKYWRQVKWYVVTLAAGNWLELAFRFGTEVGWHRTVTWEGGSQASCKLLMMLRVLGPSLANMAAAALSLHVLLTALSGSQGGRGRHLLVLGLFLLLALPLPLTQIPRFQLLPLPPELGNHSYQCVPFHFLQTAGERQAYNVGGVFSLVGFPLLVILVCGALALCFMAKRRDNPKGDEHMSDLTITGLLGLTIFLCCVPFYTYLLVTPGKTLSTVHCRPEGQRAQNGLMFWEHCKSTVTSFILAGFAYLYVYRHRHHGPFPSLSEAGGERQRLVN